MVLLLGLFSCGSNVEKINLEELNKVDEEIEELNSLEKEIDTIMSAKTSIELNHFGFLQDSLDSKYIFSSDVTVSKLDRYELVSKEKVQWSSNVESSLSGSHELYHASIHKYSDSLNCKTAFFNWLDCFGKSCAELKLDKDTTINRGEVRQVWVTESEIISVSSSCGNDVDFERMSRLLSSSIQNNKVRFQFKLDCKGRLKWKKN